MLPLSPAKGTLCHRGWHSSAKDRVQKRGLAVKVRIHIMLKSNVLDPQGKAVSTALHHLGYTTINDVRQGKYFEIDFCESNTAKARRVAEQMCRDFLANAVTEDFTIDVVGA